MMMQLQETPNQKNSLFNAMNRFLGAVNNMDQTIMVPSLLRDVPLEEDKEMSSIKSDVDEGDMYSYYQLLKSIRRDMEWGISGASADDGRTEQLKFTRMNSSTSSISFTSLSFEEDEEEEDEDLEKQFQFHLTGLQGVLSKLTQQADTLTQRYKKEIGIGGWGHWTHHSWTVWTELFHWAFLLPTLPMKSWDKRLTGSGSGSGFLYGVGLLCGNDCGCVDAEEFLNWTPHFCFALYGVVYLFTFSCGTQVKHLFIVIYSFTLCAAKRKVGERANSMKYGTLHLIRPCFSADNDLVCSVKLRMSVCSDELVPVWPALLSIRRICVFMLSSNGRRQMLGAAHDLQMSHMATELESADNASA